jgi:DNA-binding Xre family transcriptional regulator
MVGKNFDFIVLETIYRDDQDIVNEREIFWIDKLESFRGTEKGYNSDKGGSQSKECKVLSEEQLKEVKQKIKNGESYLDISQEYSISLSFISSLNHGIYWKDVDESYPLFKYYKTETDYDELIQLLLDSDLTFKEIAEHLKIGESTVKKINYGQLRKGLYPSYPIRKITPTKKKANKVKELLLNTNLSKKEIMNMVGVSDETVRCINLGKTHYDANLSYPLRSL